MTYLLFFIYFPLCLNSNQYIPFPFYHSIHVNSNNQILNIPFHGQKLEFDTQRKENS